MAVRVLYIPGKSGTLPSWILPSKVLNHTFLQLHRAIPASLPSAFSVLIYIFPWYSPSLKLPITHSENNGSPGCPVDIQIIVLLAFPIGQIVQPGTLIAMGNQNRIKGKRRHCPDSTFSAHSLPAAQAVLPFSVVIPILSVNGNARSLRAALLIPVPVVIK